jgi:restriction endonuclease S subunit
MIALIEKQIGSLLQYFIASVPLQNWLSRHIRGIAYTGINIETLKQLPIPLPPLGEQRRIVAEVERRLSETSELLLLPTQLTISEMANHPRAIVVPERHSW